MRWVEIPYRGHANRRERTRDVSTVERSAVARERPAADRRQYRTAWGRRVRPKERDFISRNKWRAAIGRPKVDANSNSSTSSWTWPLRHHHAWESRKNGAELHRPYPWGEKERDEGGIVERHRKREVAARHLSCRSYWAITHYEEKLPVYLCGSWRFHQVRLAVPYQINGFCRNYQSFGEAVCVFWESTKNYFRSWDGVYSWCLWELLQ